MHPFDRVLVDGKTIGVSTWIGYSANEGKMLTLAVLDAEYAEPGTEVIFLWGEENGGTQQADGRAPRADADAGDRQPGAVCRSGAQGLCAGRLARGVGVGRASPGLFVGQAGAAREPAQAPPHDEDAERDHAGKQRERRAVGGERHQCS